MRSLAVPLESASFEGYQGDSSFGGATRDVAPTMQHVCALECRTPDERLYGSWVYAFLYFASRWWMRRKEETRTAHRMLCISRMRLAWRSRADRNCGVASPRGSTSALCCRFRQRKRVCASIHPNRQSLSVDERPHSGQWQDILPKRWWSSLRQRLIFSSKVHSCSSSAGTTSCSATALTSAA